MENNERKIKNIEDQIKAKQQEALKAKKAGQKSKALRILGEVKSLKKQVIQISNYNTMLLQQMNNLSSTKINADMA